uniref:Uncharacterized protein n=1 Tax=Arundo donax TaxID=35708 RepID=A0A0A9C0D0_ARUDO
MHSTFQRKLITREYQKANQMLKSINVAANMPSQGPSD